MTKNYLLNPVKVVTDRMQLILAIVILIISIAFCSWMHIAQDGVFHGTYHPHQSIAFLILSNIMVVLVPSVLLFAVGKYINKGTRLPDLWNTVLFSRLPLLPGYAISFASMDKAILEQMNNGSFNPTSIPKEELLKMTLSGLIVLPLLIYSIILLVNGFKTSVYAKKPAHYVAMVIALIVAELIYRLILYPQLVKL